MIDRLCMKYRCEVPKLHATSSVDAIWWPTSRRYGLYAAVLGLGALLHLSALATLPPGLHSDEAFHMLRALDIVNGVDLPRYITGNQGNEPLMAYLTAGAIAIVGPVAWASRLVSAFASLIALAATLRLGREMAPGRSLGLAAGLIWCTLGWALTVGRLGTQPMLSVAAAAASMAGLWAGLRGGRLSSFAWGGLALGLGLDSYVAFRLFPLVPLVTWAACWWMAPRDRRRTLVRGGLVFVGVAALAYAPVASFFVQHPEWFFNRFNQVTDSTIQTAGAASNIWEGLWRSVGGLFWAGDVMVRHNIPGRPALDPGQIALFLVGVVVVVKRWRSAEAASLLSWLVVGILPGALTDSAPHFLRMATITPALAVLMAYGVTVLLRVDWPALPWRRLSLAAAWLASSAWTVWLVFTQWAVSYESNYLFDQPPRWIAEQLRQAPIGTRGYLSPIPKENYTIEYLLGPERYADLASFNGRECTVLPEQTGSLPALIAIYPQEDTVTPAAITTAYPDATVTAENVWIGTAQARVYRLPADAANQLQPRQALARTFGGSLQLLGWEADTFETTPGTTLRFNTYWQLSAPTDAAWVMFAHVRGVPKPDGNVVYAQRDSEPCDESYATWQWRVGELVIERTHIDLPGDVPPGAYTLHIGWYDRDTQARLSITDASGATLGDDLALTTIVVR